jgi:chemotaxis protein CheD
MSREQEISIAIGEQAVGRGRMRLTMHLGSCVAVVFSDTQSEVAGAIHAMLPEAPEGVKLVSRYVDSGVLHLLEAVIQAGGRRERIVARLVGGANMFPKLTKAFVSQIGERNIEAARRVLAAKGIALAGEDVGGVEGRAIVVDVLTGSVMVRQGSQYRTI